MTHTIPRFSIALLLLVTAAASNNIWGAELRLRTECQATSAIVTLGQVAEIATVDPVERVKLGAIELFPSPIEGTEQFLRVREVQDLLLMRGLHLPSHRFTGAAQVRVFTPKHNTPVLGARSMTPNGSSGRPTTQARFRQAEEQIRRAILRYLAEQTSTKTPWSIEFHPTEQQVRLLANIHEELIVRGGHEPWTGIQTLELTTSGVGTPSTFSLEVKVSLPTAVIVVVRSLARGTRIGPGDVRLQHRTDRLVSNDYFVTAEEVLGMETTRSVLAGSVLKRNAIREPILVRRGEVITVCARAAGVRIETQARASEEGGKGDLVNVETLDRRARFLAQVTGVQEAEVYARATPVKNTEPIRKVITPNKQTTAPIRTVDRGTTTNDGWIPSSTTRSWR